MGGTSIPILTDSGLLDFIPLPLTAYLVHIGFCLSDLFVNIYKSPTILSMTWDNYWTTVQQLVAEFVTTAIERDRVGGTPKYERIAFEIVAYSRLQFLKPMAVGNYLGMKY